MFFIFSFSMYMFCLINNMTLNFGAKWNIVGSKVWWIVLCKCQNLNPCILTKIHFLLKSIEVNWKVANKNQNTSRQMKTKKKHNRSSMLCTKMDEKWLIFSFIPNILHIFIMLTKNLEIFILYYSTFLGLVVHIYFLKMFNFLNNICFKCQNWRKL